MAQGEGPAASTAAQALASVPFEAQVQQYLAYLRALHYSVRTVESAQFCLARFVAWCGERDITTAADVERSHVERYQRHLYRMRKRNGEPLSLGRQLLLLVMVRGFFRWLARHQAISHNPTAELELPRIGKRLPRVYLSAAQVEQVLATADVKTARGLRDRAIMEVLYSTGIRRNELINLKLYDVDEQRGTLFIRSGKGNKDRVVPIGQRALAWLSKYLEDVRPRQVHGPDEGFVFVGIDGGAMSRRGLTGIVSRYLAKSGIGKKGSCHVFRHTMATLMLENGADIRYIQAILGHSRLTTTQVYTQVTLQRLKEVHTKTHPGALLAGAASKAGEPS